MNRSRLHRHQGTNGHKVQRFYHQTDGFRFNLKRSTVYSIIVVVTFFLIPTFFSYMARQVQIVEAQTAGVSAEMIPVYKEPSINPNVSERDRNIAIIKRVWGKDANTGLAISRCESGYRSEAVHHNTNGTIDQSLFQINSVHNMPDMDNPTANALYAYSLYQQQGTGPWSASSKCWGGEL